MEHLALTAGSLWIFHSNSFRELYCVDSTVSIAKGEIVIVLSDYVLTHNSNTRILLLHRGQVHLVHGCHDSTWLRMFKQVKQGQVDEE